MTIFQHTMIQCNRSSVVSVLKVTKGHPSAMLPITTNSRMYAGNIANKQSQQQI